MADMRDRLIELVEPHMSGLACEFESGSCELTNCRSCNARALADHLLANGVILPPCKVGDTYYIVQKYCNTDPYDTEKEPVAPWDCEKYCGRDNCSFKEYRIEEHRFGTVNQILMDEKYFGKSVFLTREEAEKALREKDE